MLMIVPSTEAQDTDSLECVVPVLYPIHKARNVVVIFQESFTRGYYQVTSPEDSGEIQADYSSGQFQAYHRCGKDLYFLSSNPERPSLLDENSCSGQKF